MEEIFDTILASLSKGNFLETDGVAYWWVDGGSYKVISEKTFKSFIRKKIVYPKRVDDETTCYYLFEESKESFSPEISIEKNENVDYEKINKIKDFINL